MSGFQALRVLVSGVCTCRVLGSGDKGMDFKDCAHTARIHARTHQTNTCISQTLHTCVCEHAQCTHTGRTHTTRQTPHTSTAHTHTARIPVSPGCGLHLCNEVFWAEHLSSVVTETDQHTHTHTHTHTAHTHAHCTHTCISQAAVCTCVTRCSGRSFCPPW